MFIASFLAATVIPFSSDAVVITMVAFGFNPLTTILVATAGNTLGGMSGYFIGRLGKWEWIEKYLRIRKEKIKRMQGRIKKFAGITAFFTWLPAVGDIIAITLGVLRINVWFVVVFMLIGKLSRYVFIVYLWDLIF